MIANRRTCELHLQKTLSDLLKLHVDEKKINHLMTTLCENANQILRKMGDPIELIKNSRDEIFQVLVDDYLPAIKVNKKSESYEALLNLINTYNIPPDDAKKIANSAADQMISHLIGDKENLGWLNAAKDLLPSIKNVTCTDFLNLQNGIHEITEIHRKSLHDDFLVMYHKIVDAYLPLANFSKENSKKKTEPLDEKTIKKISLLEKACQKYLKENLKTISEAWAGSRKSNLRFLEDACHTKNHEIILSMLEFYEYSEETLGTYITDRLNILISHWVENKPKEEMAKIDFDAIRAKVLASYFHPLPINISDGISWRAYDLLKKELEAQKRISSELPLSSSSPAFLGQRHFHKKKETDVTQDQAQHQNRRA